MDQNGGPHSYGTAFLITKSDVTVIATRAIWVGGVGDLTVTMRDGTDVTFTAVAAGTLLPISVTKVKAATTATLIYGLV